jgi:hypothetical protein
MMTIFPFPIKKNIGTKKLIQKKNQIANEIYFLDTIK